MGYQVPLRTATLVFEDGDLKGLELEVRLNVSFGTLYKLIEMRERAVKEKGLAIEDEMLRLFAREAVVGWNLTDDNDQPVPVSEDRLIATFDPVSAGAMMLRFIQEVGSISGPLPKRSPNGARSGARPASPPRRSSRRR